MTRKSHASFSKLSRTLFLISCLTGFTQTAHANLLSLSCDILNQGRFPQLSFMSGDTAIFRVDARLPNNHKPFNPKTEYRVDFKITAKATIKGFKIPFNLNESFSVPIHDIKGSLSATEEKQVELPSIHGKLTLLVSANISNSLDNTSQMVNCEKTLTIK